MAQSQARSPMVTLNDGRPMPRLGLGLMRFGAEDETAAVVLRGYEAGYRLFDVAASYGNERQTGEGLRALPCGREDFFLTTKLWNMSQGAEKTRIALHDSLERLGFDYVDLYLIHWPIPEHDTYLESWRTLIELREAGLTRSIGVSNFQPAHLERIIGETGVVPAVNQIEMHPFFQQHELREVHQRHGIVTQAWSPLGAMGGPALGNLLEDSAVVGIAGKHACAPSQVVLAWHIACGVALVPKATSAAHLEQNMAAFSVRLDAEDMERLAALDRADGRMGQNPDTMNRLFNLGDG